MNGSIISRHQSNACGQSGTRPVLFELDTPTMAPVLPKKNKRGFPAADASRGSKLTCV
jgi:hypothetical protein